MRSHLLGLGLLALSVPCAAQAAWSQHSPMTVPNGRAGMTAVYDGIGMLFFSGNLGTSGVPSQYPSELWRYDGTDWTLLSPNPDPIDGLPVGRQWYAAAFDLQRSEYVLFGGQNAAGLAGLHGDTWVYNVVTNTWAKKSPTTSPSARRWSAMEYAGAGKCVLFGGETTNGSTYNGETWEWDGSDWTLLSPATSPSARGRGKMARDPIAGEILYSSGRNAVALNETWIWDGTNWSQKANGPTRFAHAISYDLTRKLYVFYGGTTGATNYDDTWEYDRTTDTWTQRFANFASTGTWRTVPALTYVPTLGKNILFGGFGAPLGGSQTQQNSTWEYQSSALATFATLGTGCATSLGSPSLSATTLPWVGTNFTMAVDHVPATAVAVMLTGITPISLSLATLGISDPSCFALVNPGSPAFLLGMAPTGDPTVWEVVLPIPADPSLVGGSLLNQAVIVDFGANLTYVSNRGDAVMGAL